MAIRKVTVLEQHARANDSDPFAAQRMASHMKRGIVTPDDYQNELLDSGRALGYRWGRAKSLPEGEFLSMRKV